VIVGLRDKFPRVIKYKTYHILVTFIGNFLDILLGVIEFCERYAKIRP